MLAESVYPAEGVVAADPAWGRRYTVLRDGLRQALGPDWVVEHIGSTSVPGLAAKPVIDVGIRIPEHEVVGSAAGGLMAAGWTRPEPLASHHVAFLLEGGVRRGIAHLFAADAWPTAHQRLFARWLREHPDDRDAYARLKGELRGDGVWGRDYTQAKTAFVQRVVDRARGELGLPPVPVWDKSID